MIPILYKEGTNNFASFNLYLLHTAVWQLSIYNSFQIFPTFQFLSREKNKSFSSLSDIERFSQIFQVETFWPIELHTRGDRHQHDGPVQLIFNFKKNILFTKMIHVLLRKLVFWDDTTKCHSFNFPSFPNKRLPPISRNQFVQWTQL